jgi:hypothetical protein
MERNMKLFNALVGIIIFCHAFFASATTINGRFTILNATGSDFTALLQINTSSGVEDLGGATIVIGFDTTAISFSFNPVKDIDYVFHNFCDGNYSPATVTRPMNNRIWVNIDLPFTNGNNGTPVAVSPEWTDVVTIHFDIVDPNGTASLDWLTTSPFWGIYDADNSTLWEAGEFEDLLTSVEPVSDFPKSYELAQNYPNPFNPSTKIKYSIPPSGNPLLGGERGGLVTLKVYDILGNEVATLVNEEKEPGVYEVEFGGASHYDNVRNLASGIYIYRIQTSEFTDTKKMVLLR